MSKTYVRDSLCILAKVVDCNIVIYIYQPLRSDTRSIFKRSLTGLNSEFSFSLTSFPTKAEEPSLPYNLPIAGGRIIGFIPFSKGISAM